MRFFYPRIVLALLLFALALFGCTGRDASRPPRDTLIEGVGRPVDAPFGLHGIGKGAGSVTTIKPPPFPWVVWQPFRDLGGKPITVRQMLEGDELFEQNRFRDALAKYQEARALTVPGAELEAVLVREAGAQLALGNAEGSLRTLSNYFRKSGKTEDVVTVPFSLLFAYSYGSRGDIDQSLAWFSRAHRMNAGVGPGHQAAEDGVRALLRIPSVQILLEIGTRWKTDSFVSLLVGQELRRRNDLPPQISPPVINRESFARFWQIESDPSLQGQGVAVATPTQGGVLGVILPLTGQHAALGQRVKNGIELGFLGQGAEGELRLEWRDSGGTPLSAVSAYREFVNFGGRSVVLGPLLADSASAVAEVAARSPVPIITFSKKTDFQVGERVFRLGPTLPSQVKALLEKAVLGKGLRKFIVITPVGAAGEFYRAVFLAEASRLGVEVVHQSQYTSGKDSDLVSLAAEVEVTEGEGLFFPGSLREASRLAGNISRARRERLSFLGLATWDDPVELKKSQTVLTGALFVSPFNSRSEREVMKRFREAYQRKYGTAPDFLAAQGFDAATLVIAALRQSQSLGVPFEQGLRSIEKYDGLTGEISVAPSGEFERAFEVLQLLPGRIEPIKIIEHSQGVAHQEVVTPKYVVHGNAVVESPGESSSW